jgi:HEAT repeat protein
VRLLPRRGPKIEQLKQTGNVDALRKALDHQGDADGEQKGWALNPTTRAEAAAALATFDGAVVEDGLALALTDPDPRVRGTALDRISQRTKPVAVDALLDGVVQWPYPEGYDALETTVATLVGWAPPGIAEAYARKLLAPDAPELDERHQDTFGALTGADPAGEAAEAKVGDYLVAQLDEPGGTARMERIQTLLTWLGPGAVDSVIRRIDGGAASPPVILTAGALRDARAVEPLVAMIGAPEAARRSAAATALGQLGDTRSVNALIAATQDPDHSVRASALQGLNAMGVAAVIVGVASAVRETVSQQLEAGAPAPSTEQLAPGIGNSLPPAEVEPQVAQTWAQEALGRLLKRMGG